jgi:hypothetical protein
MAQGTPTISGPSSYSERTYHSKPALARRYGVSPRSIDRWRSDGKFPKPDMILPSGQPRWRDDTIERHEKASAVAAAALRATS